MTRFTVLIVLALMLVPSKSQNPSDSMCERDAPLNREEIFKFVETGVPEDTVVDAVRACRVTFILEEEDARRLRSLGASSRLVDMLAPPASTEPGATWTSPIDGSAMTWIPPGDLRMGSPPSEKDRRDDETNHDIRIARGFWIDTAEVTNKAFQRFILAVPALQKDRAPRNAHDGNYLRDWVGTQYPAGKDEQAVVWVSWSIAAAYARWAGKRLPTEAEWEYAARAGSETAYWWGVDVDASRVAKLGPAADQAASRSPWGTVAMAGGVWEWTSTLYRAYPYRSDDGREQREGDGRRVKRGGAANSGPAFLRAANRSSERPEFTSDMLGFRCVR
jgi:formylglycine-generating enzyme required for sulfatase activity